MRWRALSTQMNAGRGRGSQAQEKLAAAYREVFCRDSESVELVLADLANFCGFYKVPPIGSPPETLLVDQGLRAAFGRLFSFLSLSDERMAELEKAAREEAYADSEQGII